MEKEPLRIGCFRRACRFCGLFAAFARQGERVGERPRAIAEIKAGSIATVEVAQPGDKDKVTLTKKGDKWQVTAPYDKAGGSDGGEVGGGSARKSPLGRSGHAAEDPSRRV